MTAFPNANEMLKVSTNALQTVDGYNELCRVMDRIKSEAKKGNRTYVEYDICPYVRYNLELLGYTVEVFAAEGTAGVRVSW